MAIRVKDFLIETLEFDPDGNQLIRPIVVCADGFTVSIQRSHQHVCDLMTRERERLPRKHFWPETCECEYPSEVVSEWEDYVTYRSTNGYPETIYASVPLNLVESTIANHGGIIGIVENDEPVLYWNH